MDNIYYQANHHGESSIDFIIEIVHRYYYDSIQKNEYVLLKPIRTNTGYYGPSRTIDEIKFGNWEI